MVSIIIVNFNGEKLLRQCLDSLRNQTHKDIEIILVDNASTDNSIKLLVNDYPQVTIIRNEKNLGFAAANNIGIRAAQGKYLMPLNNDTEVDKSCIQELVKAIENNSAVGACATKILSYYNRELIDVAGVLIYPDGSGRGRGRLERAANNYNVKEEVFFVSDCAALYKKEMLDDIGLYDEDFFANHDETDLGMRAQWRGWKCLYVPTAVVYHMYSATFGAYSPLKAFLVERNRLLVAIKNFPFPLLLISPFFTLKRFFYQAYGALTGKGSAGKFLEKSSRRDLLIILLKAYASALVMLPRLIAKRRQILKNKKLSNSEFYSLFKKYAISAQELALKD